MRNPGTSGTGLLESTAFHIPALILLCMIAYSNSFNVPFYLDDGYTIGDNPVIRKLSNIPSMFTHIEGPIASRPLTLATLAINFSLGGLNPAGYHIFNLALHLANGILLYFIVIETARPRIHWAGLLAFLSSAIFLLHPIQTETVTYIISRSMLLCTFFSLLSVYVFHKSTRPGATGRPYMIGALFLSSLLAMASREDSVMLPVMIALFDFFFLSGRSVKTLLAHRRIEYLAVLLPLSYTAYLALSFNYGDSAGADVKVIAPVEYLMTQFRVHFLYLRLIFFPIGQTLDYNLAYVKSLANVTALLTLAGYMLLWALPVALIRRLWLVSFSGLWFMLTLLPTSSLIPLVDVIFEHRLYLPLAGLSPLLAYALLIWPLGPHQAAPATSADDRRSTDPSALPS